MLKNVVGALALTVFVLVAINTLVDLTYPTPSTTSVVAEQAPAPEPAAEPEAPAEPEETAQAEPAPEPEPVVEAAPAPAPAPEPVVEAAPAPVVEPAPAPVAEASAIVAAAGDVMKGKKTFRRKCMTCHTYIKNGRNLTGPNLWDVLGRDKGKVEGFRYSKTLSLMGGTWTEDDLLSFIASPRKFVTDTKMAFAGLKKETERQNVLAFLKTLKD